MSKVVRRKVNGYIVFKGSARWKKLKKEARLARKSRAPREQSEASDN